MMSKHLVTILDAAGALTLEALGAFGGFGVVAFLSLLAFGISIAVGFWTGALAAVTGLLTTELEAGAGVEALVFAAVAPLPGCFMKVLNTVLGNRWNFKPPTRPTTLSSELKM